MREVGRNEVTEAEERALERRGKVVIRDERDAVERGE